MKKLLIFSAVALFALLPTPVSAEVDNYIDHRGHNVDSLEKVVSRWTADRIEMAGDDELLQLVYDWHDLMLGYENVNFETAIFYGKKVFNTSSRKGWKAMTWASAKVIGQYFYHKEQYDSARFYYSSALKTIESIEVGTVDEGHPEGYKQFDIDNGLSSMYGTIGNLYSIQDSVEQAMEYYARASGIFEKNGWRHALSNTHYNMAETWLAAGEVRKAREDYNIGLSYARVVDDSLLIANNVAGLGRLELDQGNLRKAIRLLDEANQYYSAHDDLEWAALLENIDYTNQVLRLQKRQARIALAVSAVALLLLISSVLIYIYTRRLREQKKETDAVLNETIEELAPVAANTTDIKLSDRELQILKLVADGLSVKEIADKVFLSPETVKWYRKKLLAKFDTNSFIVLVNKAREMGILE